MIAQWWFPLNRSRSVVEVSEGRRTLASYLLWGSETSMRGLVGQLKLVLRLPLSWMKLPLLTLLHLMCNRCRSAACSCVLGIYIRKGVVAGPKVPSAEFGRKHKPWKSTYIEQNSSLIYPHGLSYVLKSSSQECPLRGR